MYWTQVNGFKETYLRMLKIKEHFAPQASFCCKNYTNKLRCGICQAQQSSSSVMKWQNTSLNDELRTNHCLDKIKRASHSHIRCLFRGQGSSPCLATLPNEEDDEAADEEDEKHADHRLPPHHAAPLLTVFAVVDRPAYFSRQREPMPLNFLS